jgi:hypothetical protein
MDREPSAPLKALQNQLSQLLVTNGCGLYSPFEVGDGSRKGSICIGLDSGGSIDSLGNVYSATGCCGRRALSIAFYGGSVDAESRGNDSMSIDGGRQSKEE